MTQPDTRASYGQNGKDKNHRETVDLPISNMSHLGSEPAPIAAPPADVPPSGSPAPRASGQRGIFARAMKRVMRALVQPFYRAAKPVVRPFASRIRRSLLEQWQLEVRAARTEMQQQIFEYVQTLQQQVLAQRTVTEQIDIRTQTLQQQVAAVQSDAPHLLSGLDRIEQYTMAAARRVAINCGPNEVLVRTQVGYVVCPADDPGVIACLMDSGDLERGTRLLIERILAPGDVFVDVGANLGLHTLAAARAMLGSGRIVAFEPYEPTMRLLRTSIFINGFSALVQTHQAAVSDRPGNRSLFLGMTSGHHSLYPLALPIHVDSSAVETPIVTLDSALDPNLMVNLLKVDVEGAELEVIAGAASVIERNQEIGLIVEFGTPHLSRTGHSSHEWLATFERLGFVYQEIDATTGTLTQCSVDYLEHIESANLLFAHPDAAIWEKARGK